MIITFDDVNNIWFIPNTSINPDYPSENMFRDVLKSQMIESNFWEDCSVVDEDLLQFVDWYRVNEKYGHMLQQAYENTTMYSDDMSVGRNEFIKTFLEEVGQKITIK